MQPSVHTVRDKPSGTAATASRKRGTRDHVAYFLAGHPAPSGNYRETQTGREVYMERAGTLPATFDGRVAVYVRLPLTWGEMRREEGGA